MGFEHFKVDLHSGKARKDAEQVLRRLPLLSPDHDSMSFPSSSYYLWNDGKHIIEIELAESPLRVSCRFTLCHPRSVDSVFLDLIRKLMTQLQMAVTICDDTSPDSSQSFSPERSGELSELLPKLIAKRRREWIAAFGDHSLAATTKEVHERVILPMCQPSSLPK